MFPAKDNAEISQLFSLSNQFILLELTCLDQNSCRREQHLNVGQDQCRMLREII